MTDVDCTHGFVTKWFHMDDIKFPFANTIRTAVRCEYCKEVLEKFD